MKKIYLVLAYIFLAGGIMAQGITFEHGSFEEALSKAKKENKLVFMDCYTTWCGPCKWLAKEIFPKEEVGDFFNSHFVNVKMDMEKGEGVELNKKYGVSAYPTLLFISPDGNAVHKLVGGMPASELIAGAKAALDPSQRIGVFKEKYENGNRDYDFLMSYLAVLKGQHDKENMAMVANELIQKYSFEKFLTKDLFFVLGTSKVAYESPEYKYLLSNRDQLLNKVDSTEYFMILETAIQGHLSEVAESCENIDLLKAEINKCKKDNESKYQQELEKGLFYQYYLAKRDFKTWFDLKVKETEEFKNQPQYVYLVHNIGDEVVRNPKFEGSKESLNRAIRLGQEICATNEGIIMGNLMLAKLYLKMGDKENAQKCFNTFFDENGKAGGNNTHPLVTNLRSAIEQL